MKKSKLPMLISVPHGGDEIPPDIRTRCLLTPMQILMDGDTWSRDVFNFRDLAEEFHDTPIARAAVDMNRSTDDLPPVNSDGVVKTLTVTGDQIWHETGGLSELEREKLLQMYYVPYHEALREAALNPKVKLAIDCHSMLDYGPGKSCPEEWEYRPLFCISNRGSFTGGEAGELLTAPQELLVTFKALLERKFEPLLNDFGNRPHVTMNDPFKGGYVTRHHGRSGSVPWIQLEINRKLYLPDEKVITLLPGELDSVKLRDIRDKLYDVFSELVKGIRPYRGKTAL